MHLPWVRTARFELAIAGLPDRRFRQAKLRPEGPGLASWAETSQSHGAIRSTARHPIDWQYGCQTEGSREGSSRKAGVIGRVLGLKGFRRSFMLASSSVRLPLRSLHP